MSTDRSKTPATALPTVILPASQDDVALTSQIHAEYEKYLEKRNAIRKASGRVRRSLLQQALVN